MTAAFADHQNRMQRYADLMAEALSPLRIDQHSGQPRSAFVRGYLLRLGFLDGWRGLVFALVESDY